MASVYSGASWTGDYTYTRVRVDYSGTSATAHLLYTRTNTWSGATGSGDATFSFGGASVGFNQTRYGQMTDSELASLSFTVSLDGGTYSGSSTGGYMGGSWSVSIPSQRTAPTGLSATNIRPGIESFTANVKISGWGNYPSSTANNRYRELQCWTYNASSLVEPRRWQVVRGTATSGDITVNNSSSASSTPLTIKGNTRYTLGMYAYNGYVSTGSQRIGNYVTLPYAATLSLNTANSDNLVINYSTPASGGYYAQTIEYSVDGGTTWSTGATVSGSSASSGTFTISGLSANTQYTIQSRVKTTAGTTTDANITASTIGPTTPTLTVTNNGSNYQIQTATYGTTNFGGGSEPIVCLYRGTSANPTTLVNSKNTTGTSDFSNTGLQGNTMYYYRAKAGAIFGSGKNYFLIPTSTSGRVSDNALTVTKTSAGTGTTSFTTIVVDLAPNTQYILSYNKTITGDVLNRTGEVRLRKDGAWTNTWDSTGTLTFTTGPTGEMAFGFYNYFNDNVGGTNTVAWSNIQVEKGSSKTSFVSHNVSYVWSPYVSKSLVTRPPFPTITSATTLEYETATTVTARVQLGISADGGYSAEKKIQYRYSTDGGTTFTDWVDGPVISTSSATTTYVDYTGLSVLVSTPYIFSVREVAITGGLASNTRTVSYTPPGTHQPPTNFDYEIYDANTSLQNWLSGFSGYSSPIYVQGKSTVRARVPSATKGTCTDGATLTKYEHKLVVDNRTIATTNLSSYPITVNFGTNRPTNRSTDYPSNIVTIQGWVYDSLDTYTRVDKTALSLSWSAPTVAITGERLSTLGTARLDISGTYARLQDSSLNNGNDCNTFEAQYRILDLNNEVIISWTPISGINTTIDTEKPYLQDYTCRVNLTGIPSKSACIAEVKVTDHFGSITETYLLDIWDKSQINDPVGCDIELWDWKTNTFVADLSYLVVGDLNITWELNDVEEVSFDMDLMEFEKKCHEMGVDSEDLLKPYAHDIRIRRNGEYILGCQLVEVNIQITNNPPSKIQVKGTGFLNLLKDQYILNEAWSGYTYAQIARKLIETAQKPDCLIKNPTGDIDTSYWLAANGTIAYSTGSHSGGGCISGSRSDAGWITIGSQMDVDTGQSVNVDMWVRGQSGVVCYVRERQYMTVSNTQRPIGQITLNGSWQHIQINNYATFFENGYIVVEMNRTDTSTPLRVDDCYVYPTDDDASLCNMGITLGVDTASPLQDNSRQVNYELQNIKDALIDLTNMEDDNFEFEFEPDRTFNIYARKGADKLDLEVGYPGNIDSMTVNRSASNVANKIIAIGSGIGDERLQTEIYNNTSRRVLGTREAVTTDSNISLEETLRSKAIGNLYDRKDPTNTPRIVIKDGSINPSNIETGDVILVEVGESDFIDSVTGEYRVVKVDYSLTEDAVEEMTLTVEPPLQRPEKKMIRYIRDSIGQSDVNTGNYWVEIEALMLVGNDYVDIARGKTATFSNSATANIGRLTDGNTNTESYVGVPVASGTTKDAVTIDLGDEYPIDYIRVWHYYGDGRTFRNNTLSVGTTLVGGASGNAELSDILWQYSGPAYIETSNGKRSKWLQKDNIVEG